MAAKITLDKFRLMWLLEGAVGKSHLRWDIYDMFVNDVFPQLSEDERQFIYAYAKRDLSWHFEGKYVYKTPHEYFKQMLARYNPANQYKVTVQNDEETKTVDAYLWNGRYYVGWTNYCAPEYIVEAIHMPFKACGNLHCASRDKCLRYREQIHEGEKELEGTRLFACEKCDLIIEQIENKDNNNN